MPKILTIAFLVGVVLPSLSWGLIGLAARFGDVIVENAEIGKTYNLREALKIPFGIENRGSGSVEVVVEIQPPEDNALKTPYEAIPDPTWVKVLPEKLAIGPQSQGFFDLLLTIPNDPSLNGRHFIAIIKAKTAGTGLLGVAVENKLRFSIGPGPESLKEEKRQKAMAQLDFDVSPQALYVLDIPMGVKYDTKKEQGKSVRVANYSPDLLSVQLSSAAWDGLLFLPQGYEPIPDAGWISFKDNAADIGPEEIKIFSPIIHIPNDPKHKGKKYAAVIRTGLKSGFWLDAPVRVYFSVKE
ncbi:MAG: hypothetical protein KCHDKBKB_01217 [Elusimicrobia bacterium]|nr:hypothetical protein [Elusimicrobiota bacterium]